MKANIKKYFTKQPQQIISALILTGILSLSTGLILLQTASAASINLSPDAEQGKIVKHQHKLISDRHRNHEREDERDRNRLPRSVANVVRHLSRKLELPRSVADAVLQDASRRLRLQVPDLRIIKAERRQWTDGCLGIRRPDILCTAVVVPGWLVTVEAGQQRLVYRTGDFGSGVVLDEAASKISDPSNLKPI